MVFQVTTTFVGPAGTPWLNRLYFGDASPFTAQDAADAVATYWGAVDALIATEVSWTTGSEVEMLNDSTGILQSIIAVSPGAGTGGDATENMATVLQALTQWRTGQVVGTHELRGRTFIPGLTQNVNDEGLLTPASVTTFTAAATALISDTDSDFRIWHRPVSHLGGESHPVVSGTVPRAFAVLRSRRD